MRTHHSHPPHDGTHLRGVALIVVLILLTVISLVSSATLRAALSAEQITLNVRLENLAREAAHIGLRHCEEDLLQATPTLVVHPAPLPHEAELWTQWHSWHGNHALAHTVPANAMSSADSAYVPSSLPQCLLETHPAHPELITVTARGFSPDHQADSSGHTTQGASAWVQSTVHRCVPGSAACPLAASPAASAGSNPASPSSPPPAAPRLQSRVWRALLNPPLP